MPFTERTGGGAKVICIVCRTVDGHAETCPLVALDLEVREMTGHVGSFVANMHETLDRIGRILRDEPEPETDRAPDKRPTP